MRAKKCSFRLLILLAPKLTLFFSNQGTSDPSTRQTKTAYPPSASLPVVLSQVTRRSLFMLQYPYFHRSVILVFFTERNERHFLTTLSAR
jgi:hypothetical protein